VTPDIRTIIFLLIVTAGLMTVTLWLATRTRRVTGLSRWNAGLAVFACAWLLIALRGLLPAILSVALADALLLAGLCLQIAALLEFHGRPVPRWLTTAPAVSLFIALVPLLHAYGTLTLVASASNCAALLIGAIIAARVGAAAGAVRWLMAGVMVLGATLVMLRAVDIALAAEAPLGMFTGDWLHAAAFASLFAVMVTSSFAFLVMQHNRAELALTALANHDALTGLANRREFKARAEAALDTARRHGRSLAVLMLDLDQFKQVNDRHGHAAGDDVLRYVAATLCLQLRGADLCGRLGGEEFAVLLPDTGLEEALQVGERIRRAVEESRIATDHAPEPLRVTVSIGGAAADGTAASVDALLDAADERLYEAKRAGRNRVLGAAPQPVAGGSLSSSSRSASASSLRSGMVA